ncbi:MAG: thermopsin family protease [Thermoplasmata archaeon]|nr:thermopsin family protease [Thermoplasmata archaeon]
MRRSGSPIRPFATVALLWVSLAFVVPGAVSLPPTAHGDTGGSGTTLLAAPHRSAPMSSSGAFLALHPPAPPRRLTHPALGGGDIINVNNSYTREPAPMGVTDFGVTPNWTGYAYATPEFQASATIHSLVASSSGSAGTDMGFQLNVEDVVAGGGSTYVFWIQDVAFFDTSVNQMTWEDNVWNLSAGTGALPANSLAGNGTINSGTYYADVASAYGSPATLTEPTTIYARVIASNASGEPHVGFEYNDGYGWIIFDNVTFPFLTNGVNRGFLVSGYQYTPLGGYLDAEWDMGGPCCGLSQTLGRSDVDMSLSYWNGHNLQAVRSAFDYGANTGESMGNVADQFGTSNSTGAVFGQAVNGSGSLGPLYGSSNVATLRVSTGSQSSGVLQLNGVDAPYGGGVANFTIAPGAYEVNLTANGSYEAGTNVTLSAGEFLTISITPIPRFALQFIAVGLPPGTPWSVNVSGELLSGRSEVEGLFLRNGSYTYVLGPVPGYSPTSYGGSVDVNGTTRNLTIPWTQFLFVAEFVAENDPGGVAWNVSIGGGPPVATTGDTIRVDLPNGSYTYSVGAPSSIAVSPASGPVNVTGGNALVDLGFSVAPGTLAGTVSPVLAAVSVDGASVTVSNGAFSVLLPAGVHQVVASLTGYRTVDRTVTLAAGATVTIQFVLNATGMLPGTGDGGGGTNPWSLGGTDTLLALGAVGAIVVVTAVLLVARRRPPTTTPNSP